MAHEDDIKKEFAKKEGVTDLGKVELGKSMDDKELKEIRESSGYIGLDLSLLPSGGRFYRDDFKLMIRAARVGEIRDYSTLNEEDLKDVDDKLNNILVSCTRILYGSQKGSYKDILEEDRIYVILSIRELTFKEGEAKLMMPVKGKNCSISPCKAQTSVELKTSNVQFHEKDETLEKYYNPETRSFSIETKSFGIINMAPPTIGVMRALTDYIRDKEQNGQSWDKSILAIIPYIQREWRSFNANEIFNLETSMTGWDIKKYNLIYSLAQKMKIGLKPEFIFGCESCGAEVTVPLTFPGGIRSLFVFSDISSELL